MRKKTPGEKNTCVSGDKTLYIGTSEEIAKVAPVKGLEPPIFLTNTYAGHFAAQTKSVKWGLIEVDIESLFLDSFASFSKKIPRNQWKKSVQSTGVCLYLSKIPPCAVKRVTIYNPTNKFINRRVTKTNPNVAVAVHKENVKQNICISKWLLGEYITAEQWHNDDVDYKSMVVIEGSLYDRSGLSLYYIRPEKEKPVKWW
jgi:hypothetical protein